MKRTLGLVVLSVLALAISACATRGARYEGASLPEDARKEVARFVETREQKPEVHGAFTLSKGCLKEAGVTYEEALRRIAAGTCKCSSRIYIVGEGTDDVEGPLRPANAKGDKYRKDVGGVTFIVSRACLAKNKVSPQEALKRMAAGNSKCAKVVHVVGEGTDDCETHLIPAASQENVRVDL
jgi:hypothetical protein